MGRWKGAPAPADIYAAWIPGESDESESEQNVSIVSSCISFSIGKPYIVGSIILGYVHMLLLMIAIGVSNDDVVGELLCKLFHSIPLIKFCNCLFLVSKIHKSTTPTNTLF